MKTDDLPTASPFKAKDRIAVLLLFFFAFFLVEGFAGECGDHRIAFTIETQIVYFAPIDLEIVIADLGDGGRFCAKTQRD